MIHTIETFGFDELSEEAQSKALKDGWDWNTSDEWWYEYIIDDAKEVGRILGIDIENVWFSGFASQGDGACFEGRYEYAKGSCKAVREYAPSDKELHAIADRLREIQREAFYGLWASVKHRGHYQHSGCTEIDVDGELGNVDADELRDALRTYMDWIYRRLETEYYWQNEDEQIADSFRANEVQFTSDGKRYKY